MPSFEVAGTYGVMKLLKVKMPAHVLLDANFIFYFVHPIILIQGRHLVLEALMDEVEDF